MNASNSTQQRAGAFRTPAIISLEREYHRVLLSQEAVRLARAAARLMSGNGWAEPRASAVLVDSVVKWLGRDVVTPLVFFPNRGPAVEAYALIGDHYLAYDRFRDAEDMMAWCCERFKVPFGSSKFAQFERTNPGPRVIWDANSDRISTRMAELLTKVIDQEIARLVLGM